VNKAEYGEERNENFILVLTHRQVKWGELTAVFSSQPVGQNET